MKEIYIFSGLGADERVFCNLDFKGFKPTFIKWVKPYKNESIENYAERLREQIITPNPILIGLSFGGMIAIEVANQIGTEKVILILSAKNQSEIPFYYQLAGKLQIHRIIPASILKQANLFTYWLFGSKTSSERLTLQNILNDTDPVFLKWAINAILNWKNKTSPQNLIHIHGTEDKILPPSFIKADKLIKGGGHFMVLNKPDEIMSYILDSLK